MSLPSHNLPRQGQDIVIIGGGPVGLACAIAARRASIPYLVIEKGCLVNSIFNFPADMTFFTTPELMEIGNHPLICTHDKPTRAEALAYYRAISRVEELRVNLFEKVTGVEGEKGSFEILTEGREGKGSYPCRRIILATGYYDNPNRMGIPGEDLPHVSHYYAEAHPFMGQRVLVVGGKNSACEAALDLFRQGAEVTLVHRGEELGDGIKYWVRPDMENRIEAGEVRTLFNTRVTAIEGNSVTLSSGAVEEYDQVFLLTGYHPDGGLLETCGLRPDPETLKPVLDPETLESGDVPGLYLAGSVSAGYETGNVFIENGRFDCEKIFADLERELG
ncbi:MAG: YpdA family putative bacillithiol disulfide reductase [Planctomycetota bacterium]|nr:YpdA family putative bacillithiol disulfide reductase [Planctomycetota bacterium]